MGAPILTEEMRKQIVIAYGKGCTAKEVVALLQTHHGVTVTEQAVKMTWYRHRDVAATRERLKDADPPVDLEHLTPAMRADVAYLRLMLRQYQVLNAQQLEAATYETDHMAAKLELEASYKSSRIIQTLTEQLKEFEKAAPPSAAAAIQQLRVEIVDAGAVDVGSDPDRVGAATKASAPSDPTS